MQNNAGPSRDHETPPSGNAGPMSMEEAAVRGYRVRARSDSSLHSPSASACASASVLQQRVSITCSAASASASSSERQRRGELAARRLMHYQCAFVKLVHDQIQRFDSAWEQWRGGGGGGGEEGAAATPASSANSLQYWNTREFLYNVNQQAPDLQHYQYNTCISGAQHYHLPSPTCSRCNEMENHSWEASQWCPTHSNANEKLHNSNLCSSQPPLLLHNQHIPETCVINTESQHPHIYENPYVCELCSLNMIPCPCGMHNTSSKQNLNENISFQVNNVQQTFIPTSQYTMEESMYEKWQKSASCSEWRENEIEVHSDMEEQQAFLKASQHSNDLNRFEMNAPSQIENYLEWRNGTYSGMEKRGTVINDEGSEQKRNIVQREQRKNNNTLGYFYPESPAFYMSNSSSNKTSCAQSQGNAFPMQPASTCLRHSRNQNTQTAHRKQLNGGNIQKPSVKRGFNGDKRIARRDQVLTKNFILKEKKIEKSNHNDTSQMQKYVLKNKKMKLNEPLVSDKPNVHSASYRQEKEKKCVAAINENYLGIQSKALMSPDPNLIDKTPLISQPDPINFSCEEHETAFQNYSKCRQWNIKELDVVEDSKGKEKWICVPFTNITRQKAEENLVVSLNDHDTLETRTFSGETHICEETLKNKHKGREECGQDNAESFTSNRTQIPIEEFGAVQSTWHEDLNCQRKQITENENTHINEQTASPIFYHLQQTMQNTKDGQSSWRDHQPLQMESFLAPQNKENSSSKCFSDTEHVTGITNSEVELHKTIKKTKPDQTENVTKPDNTHEKKLILLPQLKSISLSYQENDSSSGVTVLKDTRDLESNKKQNISKQVESIELNKNKLKPLHKEKDVIQSDENLKIMNEHNSTEISYGTLSSSTTSDYVRDNNTTAYPRSPEISSQRKFMDNRKEYLHHKNKNEVSVIWHRNTDKKIDTNSKTGCVGKKEYDNVNAENKLTKADSHKHIICKNQDTPGECTLQCTGKSSEGYNSNPEEIKKNTIPQNQTNIFPGNESSVNCDKSFNNLTPTKEMKNLKFEDSAPETSIVILPVASKITVISNDQSSQIEKNDHLFSQNKARHSEIISFESVVDTSITDSKAQQNDKSFSSRLSRTDYKEFDVIFHISDTRSIHGSKTKNPGRNLEFSQTHDKFLPCRRRTPYSIVYRFSPSSSKNYSKKQTQYKQSLEPSEATTSSKTSVRKFKMSLHNSDKTPTAKERDGKKLRRSDQQNLKFDSEGNITKRLPNSDILGKRNSSRTKETPEITRKSCSFNEELHYTTEYTEKVSESERPQAQILEQHDQNARDCSRSLMKETLHSVETRQNEIMVDKIKYQNTQYPNNRQQDEDNIQSQCSPIKEQIAIKAENEETNTSQLKISNTEMHIEQPILSINNTKQKLNHILKENTNLRDTSIQTLSPSEEVTDTDIVNKAKMTETGSYISKCPRVATKLIQCDTFDDTKCEDKAKNNTSYKLEFQSNQHDESNESSSFKCIVDYKTVTGRDSSDTIPGITKEEASVTKECTMTPISLNHTDTKERCLPPDKKGVSVVGFPDKTEAKKLYLNNKIFLKNRRNSKKVMSNGHFHNSLKNEILLKETTFIPLKQLRSGCKLPKKRSSLSHEKVKCTKTSTKTQNKQDSLEESNQITRTQLFRKRIQNDTPTFTEETAVNTIIPEIKVLKQENDSLSDVIQEEREIKHKDLSGTGIYYGSSTQEALKEFASPDIQKPHLIVKDERYTSTDISCTACNPNTTSRDIIKECCTLLSNSNEHQIFSFNENSPEGKTKKQSNEKQVTKTVQTTSMKQKKIPKKSETLRNNHHSLHNKESECSRINACQKESTVLENIKCNNFVEQGQYDLMFAPAEAETSSSPVFLDDSLTNLNKKRNSLQSGREDLLNRENKLQNNELPQCIMNNKISFENKFEEYCQLDKETPFATSEHDLNLINHSFELTVLPTVREEPENSANSSENQETMFPLQQSSLIPALVNSSETVATQCPKMINTIQQQSLTSQKKEFYNNANILIHNEMKKDNSDIECKMDETTNLACTHINNEIMTKQTENSSLSLRDKSSNFTTTLLENNNALSTLRHTLVQIAKVILNENNSYNDSQNKYVLGYANIKDIPTTKISTLKQITKQLFMGELQPEQALSSVENTFNEQTKTDEMRQYYLKRSAPVEKSVKGKIHQHFRSDLSKTKHALIHAARGIIYESASCNTNNSLNTWEKIHTDSTDFKDIPQDKIHVLKQIARELLQKEFLTEPVNDHICTSNQTSSQKCGNIPCSVNDHIRTSNQTSSQKCGNIPCSKVNSEISQRSTPLMKRRRTSSETKMSSSKKVHKKKRICSGRESFTRKIKQMAKSLFSNFTSGAKGDFIPIPAQKDKTKYKKDFSFTNTRSSHNNSFSNSKLSRESIKKQTYVPPFLYKTFHPVLKNEQFCHETHANQRDFIVAHMPSTSQNVQASLTPVIEENEDFLQEEGENEHTSCTAMREIIPSVQSKNKNAPKADDEAMLSEQANSKILLSIHSEIPKDSTSQTWQVYANNINQSKPTYTTPFIPQHTISKPIYTCEEITSQRSLMLYDHTISDPNCSCEEYSLQNTLYKSKIQTPSGSRDPKKERNEYTTTYENPYCMPVICCPRHLMPNEILNPILNNDFQYIPRVSSQTHDISVVSTQDTSTQITLKPNINDDINVVQVFIPQNSLTHNIEGQNNSETSVANEINIDIGIRTIIPNSSTYQSCEICSPCPTQYISSDNNFPFLETTQHIIARIRFESEQQPTEEEKDTDQIISSLIEKLFGDLELSKKRAICTIVKKIINEMFENENWNTCEKILLLHIIETFIGELPENLPLQKLLVQIENFADEVFENEKKCCSERQPMSELLNKSLQKVNNDFKSDAIDTAMLFPLKQKKSKKQFTTQIEDFIEEISSHFKVEPREKMRMIALLGTFIDKVFKSLKNEHYREKSSVIEDFLGEVSKIVRMDCNKKRMLFSLLDTFIDQVTISLEKCCSQKYFLNLIRELIEEISTIVELKPLEKQNLTSLLETFVENIVSKNIEIKQELRDKQLKCPLAKDVTKESENVKTELHTKQNICCRDKIPEHLEVLPTSQSQITDKGFKNMKIKKEPLEQLTSHSEKNCSRENCRNADISSLSGNVCTRAPKQSISSVNESLNEKFVRKEEVETSNSSFSLDESLDGVSGSMDEDICLPLQIKKEESRQKDICPCSEDQEALSFPTEKSVKKIAVSLKKEHSAENCEENKFEMCLNRKHSSTTLSSISTDISTRKRKKREFSISSRPTTLYEPPQRSPFRKLRRLWCILLLLLLLVIIPLMIFCGATLALVICCPRSCSEDWPTFSRLLLWNPLFGTLSHKNLINVHGVF